MARVTVEDVAQGIRNRWAAVTALDALVPAESVYVGRAAEGTAFPYAVLTVTEGTGIAMTGGKKLQRFKVKVEAYTATSPATASTLRGYLNTAFAGRAGDPTSGVTVATAVAVVHCQDDGGGGDVTELTGVRHDNADTVKLTAGYEVLLQSQY